MASADQLTRWTFDDKSHVHRVDHMNDFDDNFEIHLTSHHQSKEEKEHDAGLRTVLLESRLSFGPKSGLASARFRYSYLNPFLSNRRLSGRIGGEMLPNYFLDFARPGQRQASHEIAIGTFFLQRHGLGETTISDSVATFSRSKNIETLLINGRKVYSSEIDFDHCQGKISAIKRKIRRESGEFKQVQTFKYDHDGQLITFETSSGDWQFNYDDDGNMISSSCSITRQKNDMVFDNHGRQIRRNDGAFVYDDLGRIIRGPNGSKYYYTTSSRLAKAQLVNGDYVKYTYDHLGRLISTKSSSGNVTQYFYAFVDKPSLVSHVYEPLQGLLISLIYDDRGHLIFMDRNGAQSYVICDTIGSPILLLSIDGKITHEINRSPFGKKNFESTPNQLPIVIGFAGGIEDDLAGLLHIQVGTNTKNLKFYFYFSELLHSLFSQISISILFHSLHF